MRLLIAFHFERKHILADADAPGDGYRNMNTCIGQQLLRLQMYTGLYGSLFTELCASGNVIFFHSHTTVINQRNWNIEEVLYTRTCIDPLQATLTLSAEHRGKVFGTFCSGIS